MGGPGSGHWYRWQGAKALVEHHRCLDVRTWHRQGRLRPGVEFSWGWYTPDGQEAASIHVQVEHGRLVLRYRYRWEGGDWQGVTASVSLTWTPCPYGGSRPWLVCPGQGCGRRVAILYDVGRDFLCRRCSGLAYKSQRVDRSRRLMYKAQRIRRRLGGSGDLLDLFPPKPKGMHWRTYERWRWKAEEADFGSLVAMEEKMQRWASG